MKLENKGKWRPRETAFLGLKALLLLVFNINQSVIGTNLSTKKAIRLRKL